jgi:hypothetical protein
MAIGFCGVGLGMTVMSMLLGGVHGTIGYVQLLTSPMMDGWNPSPLNFANGNMAVRGVLMVAVVACVALTARRQNLWRTYALAAVGCILSTPHVYGYDMALLLLPLWLAVYEGRHPFTRLAATALLTPLPFLLSLAGPPWTAVEAIALFAFLIAVAVVEPRGERAYQEFCIPNYFEKSLENAPR